LEKSRPATEYTNSNTRRAWNEQEAIKEHGFRVAGLKFDSDDPVIFFGRVVPPNRLPQRWLHFLNYVEERIFMTGWISRRFRKQPAPPSRDDVTGDGRGNSGHFWSDEHKRDCGPSGAAGFARDGQYFASGRGNSSKNSGSFPVCGSCTCRSSSLRTVKQCSACDRKAWNTVSVLPSCGSTAKKEKHRNPIAARRDYRQRNCSHSAKDLAEPF